MLKKRLFKMVLFLIPIIIIFVYFTLHMTQAKYKSDSLHTKSQNMSVSVYNASKSSSSVKLRPNLPNKSKPPADLLQLQKEYKLVSIPTYDGSYQLTHPKILYFANGWNGYRYWMSMTPYPRGADRYENPSIVVSNDGTTWFTPDGLKNPVSGIPKDSRSGGHYSDPHLVMRGNTMELWYRYNPPLVNKKKRRLPDNSKNFYYRKTSSDGIYWSSPQKLLENRDGHLSLCVIHENGNYRSWYATYGGELLYSQSKNAINWSSPERCFVPLPKGLRPYHQDIIKNGSKYYLLLTSEKISNYTFQLFLFTSNDGIHFINTKKIYPSSDSKLWGKVSFYRSTLFIQDNNLHAYISLILPQRNWYVTQTTISLS